MGNVAIFSDIHVDSHKGSHARLNDCVNCLDWVFQQARNNDAKKVIFLGDLFHNRQKIIVLAYQRTFEVFEKYQDLDIILLVGNHDMWYYDRWDVSSVKPFGALGNVTVVDKPSTLEVDGLSVDFVPFTHDPVSVLASFKNKSQILCGHLAVDGALLNFVHKTYSEVELENDGDMVRVSTKFFRGWDKVFLGHYHGSQIIDNIEYVGSPLELTFNEAFQQKHIIILDTNTLKTKYVVNDFSPKHIVVKMEDVDKYPLDNNFVQVQVDNVDSVDLLEFKKQLIAKHKVNSLDITEAKKANATIFIEDVQDKFDIATGDVLDRYVQATGTDGLDEDLLKEIGRGICTADI